MSRSGKRQIRRILSLASCSAVLLFGMTTVAQQPQPGQGATKRPEFVEGRILAKFKGDRAGERAGNVLHDVGATIEREIGSTGVLVLKLPNETSAEAVARAMSNHPDVEFAELDMFVAPERVPNDPYFSNAWHLPKISAPTAWDVTIGSSGLIVAVLDTGVDSTHPDLASRMIPGWNTYDNNSNTADVYGHGTAVAGTIAASTDNAAGVSALNWSSLIMPIRISDPSGMAAVSDAAEGLTWAADRGARVANISYQMSEYSTITTAAQYFQNKNGGVVTISAGNSSAVLTTSDNPYVLTVSATDDQDLLASWSNRGNLIDVAAPGVGIYTTLNGGGYGGTSGTSFSAPIVAGVAALVMAVNPNLSGNQVQNVIKSSSNDLGPVGWDPSYGHGRVNAGAAVGLALNGTSADTTPPTVSFISPQNGETVSGIISVQVAASDNNGIASVSLKVDGQGSVIDTTAPYTFPLNTSTLPNGAHTITATAVDPSGNAASALITINTSNVADSIAPTPMITSPQNGATVAGNITISANATDNVGVVKLELYVDGALKASSSSSTLSAKWNTKSVKAGDHILMTKAYDAAGNIGSISISIVKGR